MEYTKFTGSLHPVPTLEPLHSKDASVIQLNGLTFRQIAKPQFQTPDSIIACSLPDCLSLG